MYQLTKLKSIERVRGGYLEHENAMFSVLEEVEGIRKRTGFLNERNWEKIRKTYNSLDHDFQTLLLLGIVCHDIGKSIRSLDHAQLGVKIVRKLPTSTIIEDSDIVKERGGLQKLTLEQATTFLEFLVEFHEVYGNFFTGEQSLLGFEPIMLRLPKHLIKSFFDTLFILTVAEVGSQSEHGYLYNSRVERYAEAESEILDRMDVAPDKLRRNLLDHGTNGAEVVARIFGLAYSYSTHIDKFKQSYYSTVEGALGVVAKEVGGSKNDFVSGVARIRKFAYALRWCDKLSGMLLDDGSAKPADGLEALIRLIWILTRPTWGAPENTIFEIRFPSEVDPDVCSRLKDRLGPGVLEGIGSIDFGWFMKNKKWKLLEGTLSVEYAEIIDEEVIILNLRIR